MIKEWKWLKGEMDNETWPRGKNERMGYHLMTSKPGTPRNDTGSLRNLGIGCYGF